MTFIEIKKKRTTAGCLLLFSVHLWKFEFNITTKFDIFFRDMFYEVTKFKFLEKLSPSDFWSSKCQTVISWNLKSFQKSEKFPKIWKWLGHVSSSLWSHVSRVTSLSECSLVMFFKSEWVSQSVKREPIELSGTAKN